MLRVLVLRSRAPRYVEKLKFDMINQGLPPRSFSSAANLNLQSLHARSSRLERAEPSVPKQNKWGLWQLRSIHQSSADFEPAAVRNLQEQLERAIESRQDEASGTQSPTSRAKRARTERSSQLSELLTLDQERELKAIPGVGNKNAQLLAIAGCKSTQAILEVYQKKCSLNPVYFGAHLKEKIGIKQKKWRDQIVNYCRSQYTGEGQQHNKRYWTTLSVEGNISAGKSTFLNGIAQFCPELQDLLQVAPEPVAKWQNLGGGEFNLLEEFYHNKARFAYTFQNYIFITRYLQEQESAAKMNGQPYRLLERSVWCDKMVFVQSLRESGLLSEMEMTLYEEWFEPLIDKNPTLVPDGFVYLRAGPDTCMDRLKVRSRREETGVDLKYLEDLHQKHERWLYDIRKGEFLQHELSKLPHVEKQMKSGNRDMWRAAKATMETLEHMAPKIPGKIADDVKYLNKDQDDQGSSDIPNKIQNLPALILDCEKDIHDLDAQKEHAEKVTAFFEYVKDMRRYRSIVKSINRDDQPLDGIWTDLRTSNNEVMDPLTGREYFARYDLARRALAGIEPEPYERQLAFA